MFRAINTKDKLSGRTVVLVDVSGSMEAELSSKSQINRLAAACGVAMLAREVSDDADVWTFSNQTKRVAARHGFALRDAITNSQMHSGTQLGKAVDELNKTDYDRLIVITDEQAHDRVGKPKGRGYIINVGSYKNGVGYGNWVHVDGFSESVFTFANNINTHEGGTHLTGFKTAITRCLNNYANIKAYEAGGF